VTRIYISYSHQDRALAERLRDLLKDHGIEVIWLADLRANSEYREVIEDSIRDCDQVLVLWSEHSRASAYVRKEAYEAMQLGKLLPVSLGGASPPLEFRQVQTLQLDSWSGDRNDPQIKVLIDDLRLNDRFRSNKRGDKDGDDPVTVLRTEPAASSSPTQPEPRTVNLEPRSAPAAPARPTQARTRVGSGSGSPGILGRVVDGFRGLWRRGRPTQADAFAQERVLLGASAPRQCAQGQRFAAALVAYVDAARESAKKKLEALGEPGDRMVLDVAPQRNSSWQLGAPVAARLTGEGLEVTPVEVRFEWNGRENLASFAVRARDDAPISVTLCFEVFVAEVPVSFISMRLNIGQRTGPMAVQQVQESVPSSAFASYASKDAESVTQRLSALQRWSPRLDIFQDCLDLPPNRSFQPQIRDQISRRDVFLLFWSRNAAASPWVKWEYETARDTRGLDAILPMPLEDAEIAPPPSELADRHLRDRFMLAGYGLKKIREEASRPPLV
jgi:hypothetical protein